METEFISPEEPVKMNLTDQDNNIVAPVDTVPNESELHQHPYNNTAIRPESSDINVQNSVPHVGEEILSKQPEVNHEEFLPSADFSNAVNPSEWDLLVGRGTGSHVVDSRWDRESLYQRFDPLISSPNLNVVHQQQQQKTQPPPPPIMEQPSIMDETVVISSEPDLNHNGNNDTFVKDSADDNSVSNSNQEQVNVSNNNSEKMEENFMSSTGEHAWISKENSGMFPWKQQRNILYRLKVTYVDFSSAVNPLEWDLLVSRGTGGQAIDSRWDRESLYQRFDPLISQKKKPQPNKPNLDKIASLKEQIRRDEFSFSAPPSSTEAKLISIDTPSPNKDRGRMTMRAATETQEESQNTTKFSEPLPENPIKEETASAVSDEQEIQKLKESLELQAKNFQNQLNNRTLQLKELQQVIAAASKKLEDQQQSNRVLKEYEKSIGNFETEIESLTKQIIKSDEDRLKIADERDCALEDLRSAEYAFSDLHSKYENVKGAVANFKKNEDILLKRYEEMKLKLEHRDAKLKCLQGTVGDIYAKMKNDYETAIKSEEMENQRIRAQVKKLEFRMATCEKDLQQKEKENAQLGLLCDDLIKGQGK